MELRRNVQTAATLRAKSGKERLRSNELYTRSAKPRMALAIFAPSPLSFMPAAIF